MTKLLLQKYLNGFKMFQKVEENELKNLSIEKKFQQLISIHILGLKLGISASSDLKQNQLVNKRWRILKSKL